MLIIVYDITLEVNTFQSEQVLHTASSGWQVSVAANVKDRKQGEAGN